MFKLSNLIFLFMLVFACSKLGKTKLCRAYGDDCDEAHMCCGDWVCTENRCRDPNEVVPKEQWTPRGRKCNSVHYCPDFYYCESHRCILHKDQLKKWLEAFEAQVDRLKAQKQAQN